MMRKEKHPDAGWSSLVARRAHNPKVVGSNPAPATTLQLNVGLMLLSRKDERLAYAILAQLVERNLAKVEVIGSNPMYRSNLKLHCLKQCIRTRDGAVW